jgi:tetratricopeptide (TPR) repeat protein
MESFQIVKQSAASRGANRIEWLHMAQRKEAQRRHAAYYETVIRGLNDLYLAGGTALNLGLTLFDLEWHNIQLGWSRAETLSGEDDSAAGLCNLYPRGGAALLNMRLHAKERLRWLQTAVECARRLKDRRLEARHLGDMGVAYAALGERLRAIELFNEQHCIAIEISDRSGEAAALGNLGNTNILTHNPKRAAECYEQALSIYREDGVRRGEADALNNLGVAKRDLGQIPSAIENHEAAVILYREIGYRRGEGQTLNNLGIVYRKEGGYKKAIELFAEALTIFRELKDTRGEGLALWNCATVTDKLGRRREAIVQAEAALEIFQRSEDPNATRVDQMLAKWRTEEREEVAR